MVAVKEPRSGFTSAPRWCRSRRAAARTLGRVEVLTIDRRSASSVGSGDSPLSLVSVSVSVSLLVPEEQFRPFLSSVNLTRITTLVQLAVPKNHSCASALGPTNFNNIGGEPACASDPDIGIGRLTRASGFAFSLDFVEIPTHLLPAPTCHG